ncbi:formimidoylglutamase [Flavobacterium sp. xlx-214]|uniref:formimidoylglutamase n=1 Tax=unclassified Flavobacterium TaxID=196869 RepID=UPI0013D6420B|nr:MULTISPECIES: formimidoylglutamase [unclassified Flavobacterium]MBA5793367.1 formimidoylglutamase [Flavobacterium sp. xlx-221]QMI84071.1 formimidoylglutamase [Flavobacterium sp. xlx-214]
MYEILKPISTELETYIQTLPKHSLGKTIDIHTSKSFPELDNVQIAFITVNESRGTLLNSKEDINFDTLRKNWYQLFPGNWTSKMIDLGSIEAGESIEDTYVAVKLIVSDLLKKKILPIVIGGSQDITYGMYRSYDTQEQSVNLVCIDNKIDVVNDVVNPSESFMTRIIMEAPTNLHNFSVLGYQTYFNSQEEIDLIEKMYFEAYRLGEVISNVKISEPVLRDADLVSLDCNAIKSADLGFFSHFNPNGFDGREICALARYAGLSDRVSSFGVFNIDNVSEKSLLITQILWYFVEGFNFRMNEYPYISKANYLKYIVPLEEQELIFYKSDVSDRWWIEIEGLDNKDHKILFPCSHDDYKQALQNIVPERWWLANKKLLA